MSEVKMDLAEIAARVVTNGGACVSCGEEFGYGDIDSYDHDGGIELPGMERKQWVFFHCRRCGIDSALWKIVKQIQAEAVNEVWKKSAMNA